MAGHSKWANIKHRKAATDAKRGKIFTRLAKELTVAARVGGGDPAANPRLRMAIQNARAANMPSDTIKRNIQKGTGEIEGVSYDEMLYEGYGPSGVAFIVEAVTDNKNRAVAEIRNIFSKNGGNLGESGSVAWNFERKGVIYLNGDTGASEDAMLEHVLESGADDMQRNDDGIVVYCPFDALAQCERYFEQHNFDVKESKFEYLPNTTVAIDNPGDAQKLMKLVDALEDHDDVQSVYANFELDDELVAALDNG